MKFIILLLMAVNASSAPAHQNIKETPLFKELVAHTMKNFKAAGVRRDPKQIAAFLASSFRVADMSEDFPDNDRIERALKNFCYGSIESGYRRNYYSANIPGRPYPGVAGKVVRYSMDMGWVGLNEINLTWTYQAAAALRDEKPFPLLVRQSVPKETLDHMRETIHVPKSLRLKKLNLQEIKDTRYDYLDQVRRGVSPRRMKIYIVYRERDDDDLDSMLLYRVIEEIDRKFRYWPWHNWDPRLYQQLEKIAKKYQAQPPAPQPAPAKPGH
jgi:hypothetical protein